MTRAFIPTDVKTVIIWSKLLYYPISLFPLQNFNFYSSIFDKFDFELHDLSLEPMGIKSDSTIWNILAILLVLIGCAFYSLYHIDLRNCFEKYRTVENRLKIISACIWLIDKAYFIMTFGYYIRLMLGMNQFLLVSAVYEIYSFNTSKNLKIISLAIAFFVMIMCIKVIIFSLIYLFHLMKQRVMSIIR